MRNLHETRKSGAGRLLSRGNFRLNVWIRIKQFLQAEVDKKAIPGAVILISQNGNVVYEQAIEFQDREKAAAMKKDAIFRIASMTKPITSVGF